MDTRGMGLGPLSLVTALPSLIAAGAAKRGAQAGSPTPIYPTPMDQQAQGELAKRWTPAQVAGAAAGAAGLGFLLGMVVSAASRRR